MIHRPQPRPQVLLILVLLITALSFRSTLAFRDVAALSTWAQEQGILLHDKLRWKHHGGGDDWGLVLTEPVERGTVLVQVPRTLVLDSNALQKPELLETVQKALGKFDIHLENFWIVLELYRLKCRTPSSNRWTPWLAALPTTFPQFTAAEKECLPFYARYAANYQDDKLQAFCRAVEALEEGFTDERREVLKWAFRAVNSRFWKTDPQWVTRDRALPTARKLENVTPTSELVPIGDMMNHRDPPNVQMVPVDVDHVTFAYLGDSDDGDQVKDDGKYERDLFLSYGQPGNPHRFLVLFGFVPNVESMPQVWSHLVYTDSNPYSTQVDQMTFHAVDGTVSQHVWDAILWELWQPTSMEQFLEGKDAKHQKYKDLTADVLMSHIDRQLDELTGLRAKIEATQGPNMGLIRQHNEFLTSVFTRVKDQLSKVA